MKELLDDKSLNVKVNLCPFNVLQMKYKCPKNENETESDRAG